ncbi:hypothetical protein PQO01_08580 [Lentisphaera marina]|uniref:hypothetical protein n=1 Tax=Lentisphaera marina TaxID=1111041 RepID=UPI002365EB38|nr:hypothetical protein [Lentisphaera marina]MDD7985000.1 hypothetical protein [Lentisphaera marina]
MDESTHKEEGELRLLLILRISTFCCLFAWAWQHLLWGASYGALLGENSFVDEVILTRFIGLVFLLTSLFSWTVKKGSRGQIISLAVSGILLTFMFFCKFVQVGYVLPNFIEHGGQMMTPLLLIIAIKYGVNHRLTIISICIAFTTTFIGHGIYASGLYPTPDHFYALLEGSLGLRGEVADTIIKTAGYLDFVLCIVLFCRPLRSYCMAYAAFWGAATALARPVAGMSWDLSLWGADQFLQQAIWRAPHALIPLFLYYYFRVGEAEKGANVGKEFTVQTSSCAHNHGAPICNRH